MNHKQQVTDMLRRSIAKEQNKEKLSRQVAKAIVKLGVEVSTLRRQNESLRVMLSQACDEMEGVFNTTGKLASPQIATDYCVWARYLEVPLREDESCGV